MRFTPDDFSDDACFLTGIQFGTSPLTGLFRGRPGPGEAALSDTARARLKRIADEDAESGSS
jgi:hypothetical protein